MSVIWQLSTYRDLLTSLLIKVHFPKCPTQFDSHCVLASCWIQRSMHSLLKQCVNCVYEFFTLANSLLLDLLFLEGIGTKIYWAVEFCSLGCFTFLLCIFETIPLDIEKIRIFIFSWWMKHLIYLTCRLTFNLKVYIKVCFASYWYSYDRLSFY